MSGTDIGAALVEIIQVMAQERWESDQKLRWLKKV